MNTRLNRNAVLVTLFFALLACSLAFLATRTTKADKDKPAPVEVVPTLQQQKPIQDMMAEKKALNERKEGEISGALKMLMSQTVDPTTGKVGLDPEKWSTI